MLCIVGASSASATNRFDCHSDVNPVQRGVADHVHESGVGSTQLDVCHRVRRREDLARKGEADDAEGCHRALPIERVRTAEFGEAARTELRRRTVRTFAIRALAREEQPAGQSTQEDRAAGTRDIRVVHVKWTGDRRDGFGHRGHCSPMGWKQMMSVIAPTRSVRQRGVTANPDFMAAGLPPTSTAWNIELVVPLMRMSAQAKLVSNSSAGRGGTHVHCRTTPSVPARPARRWHCHRPDRIRAPDTARGRRRFALRTAGQRADRRGRRRFWGQQSVRTRIRSCKEPGEIRRFGRSQPSQRRFLSTD